MNLGIIAFIVSNVIMCPLMLGGGADTWRIAIVSISGILGICYLMWSNKLPKSFSYAIPFLLLVTSHAWLNCISGYTLYEVAPYFGIIGLMYVFSKIEWQWTITTILVIALIQILFTYVFKIDWEMSTDKIGYEWGTVRHSIRYGTVMVTALVCLAYIYLNCENRLYRLLLVLVVVLVLFSTHQANTQMAICLIFILGFAVVAYLVDRYRNTEAVVLAVFLLLGAIVAVVLKPKGYKLDHCRQEMWANCITHLTLLGKGVGSWVLNNGNCGHPHNFILKMLYEIGPIGVSSFLLLFSSVLVVGFMKRNYFQTVGFVLITIGALTNDLFGYQDTALMWALLGGGALHEKN